MTSFLEWDFEHPARYAIQAQIGVGAYAQVVKALDTEATDPDTGAIVPREVAIKRIIGYASAPEAVRLAHARKICREVEILSLLQGVPYIVPMDMVYLGSNGADVYIVMPFIPFDLENVLEQRALSEPEIQWIAFQLLTGLAEMHKRRIYHRDLTLRNILVSNDIDVYFADFGLARAGSEAEAQTLGVVTIQYRAPEMLLHYPRYDDRADCWSIGCILAECFLRTRAFQPQHGDIKHQLYAILQNGVTFDSDVLRQYASAHAITYLEKQRASMQEADVTAEPIEARLKAAGASAAAVDLIMSLLKFDFIHRARAADALRHPWLRELVSEEEGEEEVAAAGEDVAITATGPEPPAQARYVREDETDYSANDTIRKLQTSDLEGLCAYMAEKAAKHAGPLHRVNCTNMGKVCKLGHS